MANNRPDWGAALQSLGQSLSGYAQQDYERKRQAYEEEKARQQQLADREYADTLYRNRLAEERAYNERRYSIENPMYTLPSETQNVRVPGFGIGMAGGFDATQPNPERPAWAPAGVSQVPQSFALNQQAKAAQDKTNAEQQAARDAEQHGYRLDEIGAQYRGREALANVTAAAKRSATADIYGGLPDAKAFNTFATSLVTPEELAIQGAGYQDMVTSELMKMAGEGYALDADAGAEAERRVRERITPTFSYLGQQLEYAPGAEYDGGTGQWYNPKAYAYSPPKERIGWLKDKKGELVPLPLEGAAATNVQQIQPFKTETMARDIIAPALEAGTISISQLRKVSEKTGIPWEQLASYIPDAIKKAEAASSISSSLSKRAVADETDPTSVDWSLYQ